MPLPIAVVRNGELIVPSEAAVSVFNPAIYGSFGVYESLQAVNGVVFELDSHLTRLLRSAEILDLPLPTGRQGFHEWIALAMRANEAPDCTVRVFVMGPDSGSTSTAYIWPQPPTVFSANYYTHGATAMLFGGQRVFPVAKSLNMLVSYLARRRAHAEGVHEGLLHHNGYLTEGANSNLFAVIGGRLQTPFQADVLAGVTRDVVLHLAERAGIPHLEAKLAVRDLSTWEECFITSTSRHVMPITQIDGVEVGSGSVGPVTERLMELFEEYFRAQIAGGASLCD